MSGMYYAVKIAGCGLIALSGIMIGTKLKKRLKMRKDILCAYREGLNFLESRIVLDEMALCDCMKECEKRFNENFREFNVFADFKERLERGGMNPEECWIESVNSVTDSFVLLSAERDVLLSLASTLGRSDIKHHSDKIKSVIGSLDDLISDADARLKKDGNLYVKLAVAVSAMAILLLW